MKQYIIAAFLLPGTLALVEGCKHRAPTDAQDNSKTASGVEMVLLPGGRFTMGDAKEVDATTHEVVVSSFHIDKHLVTQGEYQRVMGKNPSRWKAAANPVEQVRWSDAVRYCNARSGMESLEACYDLESWECDFAANGYRLPTEAEWEYACRAGTKTAYSFANNPSGLKDYAWFKDNSASRPRPVGQKKPNAWGLHDMHGNVWEWCNDYYKVDYYQGSPEENPKGPKTGETKVVRGGAWKFSAESCRSGYRYNEDPGYLDVCFGYDIYGFRCVRNAPVVIQSGQMRLSTKEHEKQDP